MDATLQPLLDRAFQQAEAMHANSAIDQARQAAGADEPYSYELVVDAAQPLAELAGKVLPRLIYHLESRGSHPPACEGVFLSLFVDARLYFVHARDALPLLAGAVGLTLEQLSERYGTGELRRALQPGEVPPTPPRRDGPPLMLPGKPRS